MGGKQGEIEQRWYHHGVGYRSTISSTSLSLTASAAWRRACAEALALRHLIEMVFNRLIRSLFLGRGNAGSPIVNVIRMEGALVYTLAFEMTSFVRAAASTGLGRSQQANAAPQMLADPE